MSWLPVKRRAEYPEWLEVIRLDRTDWRVSDLRAPIGDSARLLGYVEKLSARRFEVVWMGDPMRWGYVDSLGGALAGIAEAGRFTGTIAARRDRPLPQGKALLHRIRHRVSAGNSVDMYFG
jgi:hypothetical protein